MGYAITVGLAIIVIGVLVLSIILINKKGKSKLLFAFIIGSVVLLAGIIPFLINESYKFGKWYITLWEAKDVLSFYGAVLSFCGTVILGALALWQNTVLSKQNEQYRLMLMKKDMPGLVVDFTMGTVLSEDIQICIKNITNNIAYNLDIFDIEYRGTDGALLFEFENNEERQNISGYESVGVTFQCTRCGNYTLDEKKDIDESRIGFTLKLRYTDVYRNKHICLYQRKTGERGSLCLIEEETKND